METWNSLNTNYQCWKSLKNYNSHFWYFIKTFNHFNTLKKWRDFDKKRRTLQIWWKIWTFEVIWRSKFLFQSTNANLIQFFDKKNLNKMFMSSWRTYSMSALKKNMCEKNRKTKPQIDTNEKTESKKILSWNSFNMSIYFQFENVWSNAFYVNEIWNVQNHILTFLTVEFYFWFQLYFEYANENSFSENSITSIFEKMRYMCQLFFVLIVMHTRILFIVHRNIKSENILCFKLSNNFISVKFVDFDLNTNFVHLKTFCDTWKYATSKIFVKMNDINRVKLYISIVNIWFFEIVFAVRTINFSKFFSSHRDNTTK